VIRSSSQARGSGQRRSRNAAGESTWGDTVARLVVLPSALLPVALPPAVTEGAAHVLPQLAGPHGNRPRLSDVNLGEDPAAGSLRVGHVRHGPALVTSRGFDPLGAVHQGD
jgi:hypothetical protein